MVGCIPRAPSPEGALRAYCVNDRSQYLILLDEDDLVGHWWRRSRRAKILAAMRKLNGRTHWALFDANVCGCCGEPFAVKGALQRDLVYMCLPKENLYVPIQDWPKEQQLSQVHELLFLFSLLGLSEITITTEKWSETSNELAAHVEANMVTLGLDVAHSDASQDTVHIRASFPPPPADAGAAADWPTFLDHLRSLQNVYHVFRNPDWIDLLMRRVQAGATKLFVTSLRVHKNAITAKASVRLQKLGLDAGVRVSQQGLQRMFVDATFYTPEGQN